VALRERDVEFEGVPVHVWEGGAGFPVLLIHGSGPGASTLGNWRLVLEPLAQRYRILAADLIGFGLSGRKTTPPYFDLDLWLRQARAMLDLLGEEQLGVLGHSISGALALRLAATDKRIRKVLTTGCMGARFAANEHTVRTWTFPETREDLRRAAESLVFDKSVITDEYLDNRMRVLHSGDYADYFRSMFAGDKQQYIDAARLSEEELQGVTCPVLMVHGRNDLPFPFEETTLTLSRSLRQADVVALSNCGHSPALEHPVKLVHLSEMIFGAA
jgi:2-hydroxymuconate-semialdehyde hydrolase